MKWLIISIVGVMIIFGIVLALNIDDSQKVVKDSFIGDIFRFNDSARISDERLENQRVIRTNNSETICELNKCTKKIGGSNVFLQDENGEYKRFLEIVNFSVTKDHKYNVRYLDNDFNITFKAIVDGKSKGFSEFKSQAINSKVENIIRKNENTYANWGVNISSLPKGLADKIESFEYEIEGEVYAQRNNRIYLTDRIFLDFSDLNERGFTTRTENKKLIIENVTGKQEIDLDPTLSLSDGTGILDDSFVREGNSGGDGNDGTATDLEIRGTGSGGTRRAYIKWDLSDLPLGGTTIEGAEMKMYLVSQSGTGSTLHEINYIYANQSWDESTITWNNQPCGTTDNDLTDSACNDYNFDYTSIGGATGQVINFNMTNITDYFIRNDRHQTGNFSILIRDSFEGSSGIRKDYSSKEESTTSQRPELEINYTLPANVTLDDILLNSTSNTNTTDENLTINIISSTNADTFVYEWYKNGTALSSLNLPFDIGGSTVTEDFSKNKNNGILVGGVTYNKNGLIGGAYSFSGNQSGERIIVDFPAGNPLQPPNERPRENLTMMAWFNTLDNSTPQKIIHNNVGGTGTFWSFSVLSLELDSSGRLTGIVPSSGGFCCNVFGLTSTTTVTENEWHLAVITYSNSTGELRLYLDGVEEKNNTATGTLNWGEDEVSIGAGWNGALNDYTQEFNGSIDEVMIFNQTLTAQQINSIYLNGVSGEGIKNIVSQETEVADLWWVNVTGINVTTGVKSLVNKSNDLLVLDVVGSDTCTYTSGNWDVDCSDNCVISSNVDVGGNNITISGTGTFVTSANISNYNKLHIEGTDSSNICRVTCITGGCFKE